MIQVIAWIAVIYLNDLTICQGDYTGPFRICSNKLPLNPDIFVPELGFLLDEITHHCDAFFILLTEKAMQMGANAVMDVEYKHGVGFATRGYMKATGTAIKTQS